MLGTQRFVQRHMSLVQEHQFHLMSFEGVFHKEPQKGSIHWVFFFCDIRTEYVWRLDPSLILLAR